MAIPPAERERVLRTVERWPIEDQVTLAQAILGSVAARLSASPRPAPEAAAQRSTWDALHGIAANGQTPPTDEEVEPE